MSKDNGTSWTVIIGIVIVEAILFVVGVLLGVLLAKG